MKFYKILILFSAHFFISHTVICQNKDKAVRKLFSSIVYLSDSISQRAGTGFLISKDLDDYLVTAEHVAKSISIHGSVQYRGENGTRKKIPIAHLLNSNKTNNISWIVHPTADVAVLHLGLRKMDSIELSKLDIRTISYSSLNDSLAAPDRLREVTVFGFPLNLGISSSNISPVTKNLRPSSDIVYIQRADNKKLNPFFILDDPSISGFSGGPVMHTYNPKIPDYMDDPIEVSPTILGLVHGTISDKTGGFAAIVPSINIVETIELAPSFNGLYKFYYPNGKLWSERIYKNGIPWRVISNYSPEGESQEKGTLKNGNGTIEIYDESGTLKWSFHYKNGRPQGNSYHMSDAEIMKSGMRN
ncbi:trypsin-like peptidase domain-containing protein [Pricia sp. S334]|uniref:Trypsin-like peptidase domain-containing protein n=1 Tax=Pricia mediterranea TaxID=3076079 RepID=A0ABU3L464_9FLAO|nr:trypsin-like peptidase domain-containing protein [Pricia sp. S334]MDT7827994.1 trypsin-like peptidase domain-containing protein [Pricia sp. S334]